MNSKPPNNPFLQLKARSMVLMSLLIMIGLIFGLSSVLAVTSLNPEEPILIPILYTLFFLLLCLWELGQLEHLNIQLEYLVGQVPQGQRWLPMVGLVILILIFSLSAFTLSFYLLSFINPNFVEEVLKSENLSLDEKSAVPVLNTLLTLIVVVGVAPIVEEFIFRGILLHRWATKWGLRPALIVTSLTFGILHANVIGLSVFGLIMGLLYIQTRSLVVPIACHALNNAMAMGLTLIPLDADASHLNTLEQFRAQWWVGCILLILSAPWLIWFIYKTWPSRHVLPPYFININPSP